MPHNLASRRPLRITVLIMPGTIVSHLSQLLSCSDEITRSANSPY